MQIIRAKIYFNPRSPRGGATAAVAKHAAETLFQSTLPTRGSDRQAARSTRVHEHFNPRSPRGGATRAGNIDRHIPQYFNPRSPRGGATVISINNVNDRCISIHAPHEGERQNPCRLPLHGTKISIHAPHEGERPAAFSAAAFSDKRFQSTLPTRGSD